MFMNIENCFHICSLTIHSMHKYVHLELKKLDIHINIIKLFLFQNKAFTYLKKICTIQLGLLHFFRRNKLTFFTEVPTYYTIETYSILSLIFIFYILL